MQAAGTATANLLRRAFEGSLMFDHADPPADPPSIRNVDPHRFSRRPAALAGDILAAHGHFHPAKSGDVEGTWVTVLRHPVDTIVSLYWFWLSYESDSPLHPYFRRSG